MDRPGDDRRWGEADGRGGAGREGGAIEGANVESAQSPLQKLGGLMGEESGDDKIRDGMRKMRKSDRVIKQQYSGGKTPPPSNSPLKLQLFFFSIVFF